MKKILIFILGLFMFSSLVSHSAEVYETASADFMNAVKTLILSETKSNKNLKDYIEKYFQRIFQIVFYHLKWNIKKFIKKKVLLNTQI